MFGTHIASGKGMEILRTLGQVPLMFLGGFLIVLAIAVVWAIGHGSRSRHRVRDL
jgi:hypothetical protein